MLGPSIALGQAETSWSAGRGWSAGQKAKMERMHVRFTCARANVQLCLFMCMLLYKLLNNARPDATPWGSEGGLLVFYMEDAYLFQL